MRQRVTRVLTALVISVALMGGTAAIAHAASSSSPKNGTSTSSSPQASTSTGNQKCPNEN
jgi:hypothetical protein